MLSLKEVRNYLYSVRLKWLDIGVELEVDETELKAIRKRCREDPGDCLLEMIGEWLRSVDGPVRPTWKALAEALRAKAVNERALADESRYS